MLIVFQSLRRLPRIINLSPFSNVSCIRYQHEKVNAPKPNYSGIKPLRRYVLSSYVDYVQNYENALERRFPAAIRIYRVFKIGVKDFYKDVKAFISVVRKVNTHPDGVESLTRQELDVYFKMPRDMYQVAPVLLLSALPLANYVIFPLAYLFPRYMLSSHFWSLQQRIQFAVIEQKSKLRYYKPVFRCLQAQVKSLKGQPNYNKWRQCIALLGSGLHPSEQLILACEPLFCQPPYNLSSITSGHLRALLQMHSMHIGWRKRKRLADRARMIHLMDMAIDKEGGISHLSQEEVRMACFLRGLNPTNMNSEETVTWLNQWVEISKHISEENLSFLLHLPILTAYNHPSNWVLIH